MDALVRVFPVPVPVAVRHVPVLLISQRGPPCAHRPRGVASPGRRSHHRPRRAAHGGVSRPQPAGTCPAEYLALNPRGQVPALSYDGTIIAESAIVAQFLADTCGPSHLSAASDTVPGALQRARVAFFVDAFFAKFQYPLMGALRAKSAAEERAMVDGAVAALATEVEPLLEHAGPFFGGSARLTMAEVLTGSFVLRLVTLPEPGVYPAGLIEALQASCPRFWTWAEHVSTHPSVTKIYNVQVVADGVKKRFPKQFTA